MKKRESFQLLGGWSIFATTRHYVGGKDGRKIAGIVWTMERHRLLVLSGDASRQGSSGGC